MTSPDPRPYDVPEPHAEGLLDVGGGHRIAWRATGDPAGKPVVLLHGGPGGGPWRGGHRWFDPARYRVIGFDQRMCGGSTPSASAPLRALVGNTTADLVHDLERLRRHLGIERWLVCGASWGTTLGLAYAERFPERVSELLLVAVALTRRADVRWLTHDVGRLFPEAWERFRDHARAAAGPELAADLVEAYHHLLHEQSNPKVRAAAALEWCTWEDAVVSLEDGWAPNSRFADPNQRMTFARIVTHFFRHAAWLEDGELLRGAARLAGIPGVIVHGRFDLGCPPDAAWALARAWPQAELHLVRTGHVGGGEMLARVLEATDRWGRLGAVEAR